MFVVWLHWIYNGYLFNNTTERDTVSIISMLYIIMQSAKKNCDAAMGAYIAIAAGVGQSPVHISIVLRVRYVLNSHD